jgi:hypothetical protein
LRSALTGVWSITRGDEAGPTGSATICSAFLPASPDKRNGIDASGNAEGSVVLTITSGTRRFDGASGTLTGSFTQIVVSTSATTQSYDTHYSLSGTISY